MLSLDLCASTATLRNEVGAAGDRPPLFRCFCSEDHSSGDSPSLLGCFCLKCEKEENNAFCRRATEKGGVQRPWLCGCCSVLQAERRYSLGNIVTTFQLVLTDDDDGDSERLFAPFRAMTVSIRAFECTGMVLVIICRHRGEK